MHASYEWLDITDYEGIAEDFFEKHLSVGGFSSGRGHVLAPTYPPENPYDCFDQDYGNRTRWK